MERKKEYKGWGRNKEDRRRRVWLVGMKMKKI
jgi:hypothetical protein